MATPSGPIRRADAPDSLTIDGLVAAPATVARPTGPLAPLLDESQPTGDHGTVHSGDGLFLASIPLETLRNATLSSDGRLSIENSPTKCWLVKDVRHIEVTNGRQPDSLPHEERAKT